MAASPISWGELLIIVFLRGSQCPSWQNKGRRVSEIYLKFARPFVFRFV